MVRYAVDDDVWLTFLVAQAENNRLPRLGAVLVSGSRVRAVIHGDAGVTGFHQYLRWSRPFFAIRSAFRGFIEKFVPHGFGQIDKSAAVGYIMIQARPSRALDTDVAVGFVLPAQEFLYLVMSTG